MYSGARAALVGLMTFVFTSGCVSNPNPAGGGSSYQVTTRIVEETYADLLSQMRTLAECGVVVSGSDRETYKKLVSPEEILEAKVGSNHSYMILGGKSLDWKERWSLFPKTPKVGRPVINRYRISFANGRQLIIASYESRVFDKDGQEEELVISFDLTALEKRLRDEKEQKEKEAGTVKNP